MARIKRRDLVQVIAENGYVKQEKIVKIRRQCIYLKFENENYKKVMARVQIEQVFSYQFVIISYKIF